MLPLRIFEFMVAAVGGEAIRSLWFWYLLAANEGVELVDVEAVEYTSLHLLGHLCVVGLA